MPDVDIENLSWSPTDIEFPSTSTSDEVEVQKQETNIATHLSELVIGDKLFAEQLNENENGSLSKFVLDDDASICKYSVCITHTLLRCSPPELTFSVSSCS